MAKKVTDDWLGMDTPVAPEQPVTPDPTVAKAKNDVSAESEAKRRAAEEAARKGRRSLRVDLTAPSGGGGGAKSASGVSIPL